MPDHPQRVVRLAGASNFRDLGGYPGLGGRRLRWRLLYRSEHLGGLTPDDHAVLAERRVVEAIDFRGVGERAAAPYEVPGLRQHSLAIEPVVVQRMQALAGSGRDLTAPVVSGLMQDLYRDLVNDQSQRFAEFFARLLDSSGAVVFHCTAGKDRTGIAAALLLLALGVPLDLVRRDYLLTNELYQPPFPAGSPFPQDVLRVLWGVQQDFLDAALEAIDAAHGGMPRYLRERLDLDDAALAALAERFLEPG
jgi:protein-tyrosine phosphatase